MDQLGNKRHQKYKVPACMQHPELMENLVTFEEALERARRHAAHVCLCAPGFTTPYVMMQLRFDGTFGFPGGYVDEGENMTEGLNRELVEEVGWKNPSVTAEHYVSSHMSGKLALHFFAIELTNEEFIEIEENCVKAPEYGQEVLGTVRVPLYSLKNGLGLPAFLQQKFIGNARDELLLGIYHLGLTTEINIHRALQAASLN